MTAQILTVSELNRAVRGAIEQRLPLMWVAGEISNLTRAPSGHFYFTLKDAAAQVRCVMFRARSQLLPWRVENGQHVEAQVLATLYEPRGEFQLNVETMRRGGLGKLYEAFVQLRDRLAREGLFDATAKRALPRLPRCIGVVTSPQAAALRDILAALKRRAPQVPIVIYPTPVQGEGAAARIAAAVAAASTRRECDVLLVARGGGSLEDLWAFNDEALARAIRACAMPVVAGVGHETDVTIADMAADVRAPTPTAAAEFASAGWHAAAEEAAALAQGLRQAMRRTLERRMQAVDVMMRRLVHPAQRVAHMRQRLSHLATRLAAAARHALHEHRAGLDAARLRLAHSRPSAHAAHVRLDRAERGLCQAAHALLAARHARVGHAGTALAALSPAATLARGYAIVRDARGRVVMEAASLRPDDALSVRLAAGQVEAVVIATKPD